MEKKTFTSWWKLPSKPTGPIEWGKALKSILLVFLAVIIAQLTGLGDGTKLIMLITLNATIMIDLPLPFSKIIQVTLLGFFLTLLAFICSFLSLSSLPVFLFFTIILAVFSSSLFIFSETAGSLGFLIFINYIFSVIFINQTVNIREWVLYLILSFLVASILLVPRALGRKADILRMISTTFLPETSLERVLSTRKALSGLLLDERDYNLLKIGTYLTRYRTYSKLIISTMDYQSQLLYNGFMDSVDKASIKIASRITGTPGQVDLKSVHLELEKIEKGSKTKSSSGSEGAGPTNTLVKLKFLLKRANELLLMEYPSVTGRSFSSPRTRLREVIAANFNLNNLYIHHVLRYSLALTLGLLAVYLSPYHDRDFIWITMGILIIMKPDVTSTVNNFISRGLFNFLAIILVLIMGLIFPHDILLLLGFLMLFFFRAFFPNYMGLSLMAITIFVVLTWPTGPLWENAIARVIDITLGGIIAFCCAYLIWPGKLTVNIPEQIARNICANCEYAENIFRESLNRDKDKIVPKSFRKYLLEEKNLESSLRKVEDTFQDVAEDIALFMELGVINRKLFSDLTKARSLLESGESIKDITRYHEQLTSALREIALSVDKNVILPPVTIDRIPDKGDILEENIENYLNMIINDVHYLQLDVELALRLGAFKKYSKLI
ncbi:FUSC family protein [uncultured Methanobacterium sp.]|uniref:FUSC family protein n=1 Tax=uncultured Methanobacterium sp. TaxID=176306 RepID=UPI002AA82B39|nr:FUSC family protein [uncultured Methanobacterium sp.]